MATNPSVEKIANDPRYKELVAKRDGLAWLLTALVLVVYFGFTLMIAFAGDFLTQKIAEDSVIPIGMPMGVGVILISIAATAVYVWKANTTFDHMIRDILQEIGK